MSANSQHHFCAIQTPEPKNKPVEMSDSEFAEGAQNTCQQLQEELSNIASSKENFVTRYALAAEAHQAACLGQSV
jgi:hypothetical protein